MLTTILSNFGLAAALSALVVVLSFVAALFMAARARAAGHPMVEPTVRVLAVGSVLLIIAATASPHSWPPERYGFGDLALEIGRGGLGQIDQALAAPTSLAALLLFANVVLYVPLTLFASLGWAGRTGSILLAALLLALAVETVQFLALDRVAATDDIVLNMSGAVIGLSIGVGVRRLRSR